MSDDDFMTEEEFAEMFHSLTEDEQIEVCRKLFYFSKENREALNIPEEKLARDEEKLMQFIEAHERKKRLKNLLHQLQRQLDLTTERIEARLMDMYRTESDPFFGDDKKRRSH